MSHHTFGEGGGGDKEILYPTAKIRMQCDNETAWLPLHFEKFQNIICLTKCCLHCSCILMESNNLS